MTETAIHTEEALETKPFSFTGTAKEYFGIWIVNLFLSIITLGIYTAWAKVRRLRYFYGNTWLDGHNFEYHAKPIQILIGRIIVVGYLVFTNIVANFYPIASLILILPYFVILPWVINKALAFNARMTSYRNVRFSFAGSYLQSLGILILMPLLVLSTLGLIAPIGSQMAVNYLGNNTKYGDMKFHTDVPLGALYGVLGWTILFTLAASITLGIAIFGAIVASTGAAGLLGAVDLGSEIDSSSAYLIYGLTIGIFAFYAVLIFAYVYYRAGVRNVAYNFTTLDAVHRLRSTLSRLKYVWIIFSNFVLVILTVGLMRPWAAIRTWSYLATNTALLQSGELAITRNMDDPEGNVATAEYLDIDGIDFGL